MVSLDRIREYVRGTRGQRRWIVVVLLVVTGALGLGIGTIDEGLDGDFPGVLPDDSDPPDAELRTPTPTPTQGGNTPAPTSGENTSTPVQSNDNADSDGDAGDAAGVAGESGNTDAGNESLDTKSSGNGTRSANTSDDNDSGNGGGGNYEDGSDGVDLRIVNDTARIQFADRLPGDRISQSVVVKNNGSGPGEIATKISHIRDHENNRTEPEAAVDGTPDEGELSSALRVRLVVEWSDGSTTPLTDGYVSLEEIENETNTVSPNLGVGEEATLELDLRVPADAGNEIQTDGVTFDCEIFLKGDG